MIRRYLCVYLPLWSVNLARKRSLHRRGNGDEGTLLITRRSGQLTVARCCTHAHEAGVREGSSLALAKALVPSAMVAEFDPTYDYRMLCELARWALRFTPVVGVDSDLSLAYRRHYPLPPLHHGIVLDLTGTERLYRGEENVISKLTAKFKKAGIHARIATAPSIGAAWALSRFHPEPAVILASDHSIESALSTLPLEALRLPSETLTGLSLVGVRTVEALLALPRKSVLRRFGAHVLERIDAVFGRFFETIRIIDMIPSWVVGRTFEVPIVRHAAILRASLLLVEELSTRLRNYGKKALIFTLVFVGREDDGTPYETKKELSLHAAVHDTKHLVTILLPIIESTRFKGGVEKISLTASNVEDALPSQKTFSGQEEIPLSTEALLNTLVVRLGGDRVRQVQFLESYVPERSYRMSPVSRSTGPRAHMLHVLGDRPSLLFERPEAIAVVALLPDRPPVRISWRNRSYRILRATTPERISEEWWNREISSPGSERDYFKVEDETGRWLWIFRSLPDHEWYIHGMWA
jgi:protein ImuB